MRLPYLMGSVQFNMATAANLHKPNVFISVYRYFLPVETDIFCQNKCSDPLMEDMKIEYHFKIKVHVLEICE